MSKKRQLTLSSFFQQSKKPKENADLPSSSSSPFFSPPPAPTPTPEPEPTSRLQQEKFVYSQTSNDGKTVQSPGPAIEAVKESPRWVTREGRGGMEQRFAFDSNAAQSGTEQESERDPVKEKRHAEFVARFGKLEQEREQKRRRIDETESKKLWSPLELQVLELKKKHPGVLLAIEVGYKFRFFGDDAKTASRVLHIAHFIDRNFYVASIPTHRLAVHVRRLVHAGHKVGVVRQTETAALKASGSNKGGPFLRELKHLYTKGTFVDEMATSELELNDPTESSSSSTTSNYLLCIVEEKRGGGGPDERVQIGLVAVQPATGDVTYDSFEDGYMRSELETRILHIEPCELLLPYSLSKATEKVVQHMSTQRTTAFGESVRVERMPENDKFISDYNAAFTHVSEFYTRTTAVSEDPSVDGSSATSKVLFSEILRLPDTVIKALAATIRYLTDFGLQHALQLTKYFVHFSSRSHMLLNGNTMANLEIYRNSTNYTEKGSLFSVLDHTRTSFGKRLLRKWVGRPLVDVKQLNQRINAVDELLTTDNPNKDRAKALLKQIPDLEKGLSRIHYGQSSPAELVQVLDTLFKIANTFHGAEDITFNSPLLNDIFALLPTIRPDVIELKKMINPDALSSSADRKIDLLKEDDRWPELAQEKENIARTENELDHYLSEIKSKIQIPSLQYTNVAGIEYLLEVKNTMMKKVPKEWIKINGTKAASRFHTPWLIKKLKERERHKELLDAAFDKAYRTFLAQVTEKYETFRDVVLGLAQLDCLFSLATVAQQPNYVKPTFSEHAQLKVVNGRHPMVEQLLPGSYVPNDINFDMHKKRTMILTGPNMGGKSSYIRQVALIAIMGQIGSYVPADSAELGILDAVYTRMGALDNMLAGESTFMVELHETSDIMRQATPRSLVILDELGRGTSTHDGMAIAYAVLRHFITEIRSITLFVTHYPFLAELADEFPETTTNGHMDYIEDSDGDLPNIVFLYKLVQGVSTRSYGINVARLADLPRNVLQMAKVKAAEMEENVDAKVAHHSLVRAISDPEHNLQQLRKYLAKKIDA